MSRTFLWLTKLRLQIRIGLLVILGLTLIFAFMAWQGMQTVDAAIQLTLQERLALARAVAMHLDQDLERTLNRLTQVAAFPTINLEDGDLEPEKAELRRLYRPEVFSYVFLLDKDRRVLWTEPYLPKVVGSQHVECPHMQEILRTGQPAIVPASHTLTPQTPVVAPMVPIKNKAGTVVGLLGAGINPPLRDLWSSQIFSDHLRPIVTSQTRYAQLVDDDGIVLAHTQGRNLFQRSEHADLLVPLLREKRAAITIQAVTEEGKGTIREVIAFAPLSQVPWGIVLEQAEAELLAPVFELRNRILLFAAVAMASALLLVWVTTRSVIQPVNKLMAVSERIAAGDLTTPVPPLGEDEIGKLGQHFEKMRKRLVRWSEELETAVQKRTRELSTLYAIDRAAAQSLNLDEILNDSLDKVLEVLEMEAGGIFLLEPDGETMTLRVHRGVSDEFVRNVQRIKLGEGVSGRAAAEKQPVVLDVADYPTERLAPYVVREGIQTLASTPLISAGTVVGALNLATRRPRAFPPEEMELLTAIGRQLGGAAQNARLFEAEKHRAEEMATLVEMNRAITEDIGLKETLDRIINSARKIIPVSECSVSLVDELNGDMVVEASTNGEIGVRISPTVPSAMGWVAKTKQLLAEEDVSTNPIFNQELNQRYGIQSAMVVPIVYKGKGIGALGLSVCHGRRAFSDSEKIMAQAIADQAAIAIQNARLYEETRQRAERLSLLNRIAHALSATLNLDELLEIVYREITTAIQSDAFFIALYDRATNELDFRIQVDQGVRQPPARRPLTPGLTSSIITSKQPLLIRDFEKEKEHLPPAKLWGTMQAPPSWVGVPMLLGDQVVGAISVQAYRPNIYGEAEQELLSTIADAVAVAIENARLYQREKDLARYLRSLNQALARSTVALTVETVVQTVVKCLVKECGAALARLWLTDESGEYLILRASAGLYTRLDGSRSRVSIASDPYKLGVIAREHQPHIVTNQLHQDPYVDRDWAQREGLVAVAGYPILVEARLLGVVVLFSREPLGSEMLDVLGAFVNQVAIALENVRLYVAEQRRAARLAALQRLSIELAALREESAVLNTLVDRTAALAESPTCTVMLIDETTNEAVLAAQTGLPEGTPLGLRVPLTLPIIRQSLETGEPIIVPDIDRDAPESRQLLVCPDVHAFFAYPMVREGRTFGYITLSSLMPRTPSAAEISAYRLLAERAAVALENARLYTQTQQNLTRVRNLYELSTEILTATTTEETARVVVQQVVRAAGAHSAMLNLLEPDGRCTLRIGMDAQGLLSPEPPPRPDGTTMEIFRAGEPLIVADVTERRAPIIPRLVEMGIKAFIGLPLKAGTRVTGVLFLRYTESRPFSADEVQALTTFANQAATALEKARLYQGLEESKTALEAKVRDLERFTRFAVGRELQMKELKERIRELEEPKGT